jgi:RNA polymerase sigma factor (sigma-70 family)
MTAHQDQQYITALVNNDTTLINELYVKYASKIKAMVLKNNGTESDAGDVFQEALLAIYQRAKTTNFVLTCPLDAYLYMICKNRWINELHKKSTKKVTFIDEDGYTLKEDVFNDAAIVQNQYERINLLQDKFKELGDGCKELLELSWSGLAMDEVAKKLRNSYGYIRKKKSECMAKLIALVKTSPQFVTLQW